MIRWKKKCADGMFLIPWHALNGWVTDSETFNWLKVNTQICPKCKTSIEKNGGCMGSICCCFSRFLCVGNHMTCAKCRHECKQSTSHTNLVFSLCSLNFFSAVCLTLLAAVCWICHGDWKSHQSCNKFQGSKDTSDDRAALERYLHYYHRFTVHENSKNLEGKLRERVRYSFTMRTSPCCYLGCAQDD
jgi:ariadne-1